MMLQVSREARIDVIPAVAMSADIQYERRDIASLIALCRLAVATVALNLKDGWVLTRSSGLVIPAPDQDVTQSTHFDQVGFFFRGCQRIYFLESELW